MSLLGSGELARAHQGHAPARGKPPATGKAGPFSVEVCGHSEHGGSHDAPAQPREDYVIGKGDGPSVVVNGVKGIRCRTWVLQVIPFAGTLTATAEVAFVQNNRQFFDPFAGAKLTFSDQPLVTATAEVAASCLLANVPRFKEPNEAHDTAVTTALLADELPSFARLRPIEETLALATSAPRFDHAGGLWEGIPPSEALRVRSSVSITDGVTQYRYELENTTDLEYEFAFDQIASPESPKGWSGIVKSRATVSLTIPVQRLEMVYRQRTQVTVTQVDDPERFFGAPFHVYVPESRLEFAGRTKVVQAEYDAETLSARLAFVVEGSDAEGAVVYRERDGRVELVRTVEGPLAKNQRHEVLDPHPPLGPNTYRIKAGRGVNGSYSKDVVIVAERKQGDWPRWAAGLAGSLIAGAVVGWFLRDRARRKSEGKAQAASG